MSKPPSSLCMWCVLHHVRLSSTSVHGILQAGILQGLPFPPPGDLPNPGIRPMSLASPALQADSLSLEPTGKPSVSQSVQLLSRVWLFATPWIAAHQASVSITNSRSLLRLLSIVSVMPSSHLILCCPLLLLPPTPPSIRVFSNESTLCMRCPKYWSFSFSITLHKPERRANDLLECGKKIFEHLL